MKKENSVTISDEQLNRILEVKREGWGIDDLQPKNEEYGLYDIREVKLHDFVYINPPHDKDEFVKLMESIATNGQIEPVKIWEKRGSKFVIDGRHRYLALKALGVEFIKYVNISSNTTKEELKTLVIESENKRQMTPAQNAIRAWRDYSENHKVTEISMRGYASMYHTGHTMLSRCKKITEKLGSDVLDSLFKYKIVELGGSFYKSLNQVELYIKEIEKNNNTENTRAVPESAESIVPLINALVSNTDIEALAYLKKVVARGIDELNKD